MSFCRQCGAELQDGAKFCTSCGTPVGSAAQPPYPAPEQSADAGSGFDPQDAQQNKVMAILSYLGFLVLIPAFTAKDSKFVRFHANQGLLLFICECAYGVLIRIMDGVFGAIRLPFVPSAFKLLFIVFLVFSIIGIVNAAKGKAQKLPVIGSFDILK